MTDDDPLAIADPADNGRIPPPAGQQPPQAPHPAGDEQPTRTQQEQQAAKAPPTVDVVTIHDFAAIDEPGADALLGDPDQALIPAAGDVMIYGDGGAGKTTLCVDLACHLAAGDTWLGIPTARPLRILLLENEGPRPLFRRKLAHKLAHWHGSDLAGRLTIVQSPWAELTFAHQGHRQALADAAHHAGADILIAGPLIRLGMRDAGTLEDIRAFMTLVTDLRRRTQRPLTCILVHHENKGGKVSGAWEGAGDTLLHVTGQGHGRTRLHVQKARWSTAHHAVTMNLAWTDGAGFKIEERPQLSDDELADQLLDAIQASPGIGWAKLRQAIPGVSTTHRQEIRDRLLADGTVVNIVKMDGVEVALSECPPRRPAHLFLADDPTIRHLAQLVLDPEPDGNQAGSARGADGQAGGSQGGGSKDPPGEPARERPPADNPTGSHPRNQEPPATHPATPWRCPACGRRWRQHTDACPSCQAGPLQKASTP